LQEDFLFNPTMPPKLAIPEQQFPVGRDRPGNCSISEHNNTFSFFFKTRAVGFYEFSTKNETDFQLPAFRRSCQLQATGRYISHQWILLFGEFLHFFYGVGEDVGRHAHPGKKPT